jgi:hypothetical protein
MNKQTQPIKQRLTASALAACASLLAASAFAQDGFITTIKPYTVPVGAEYQVRPILSVGDRVPETSDPTKQYQMVGIPDGLGAYSNADGTVSVLMNHELTKSTISQPVIGGPANRGALISRFTLAADGSVLSGERAYDTVFDHFSGATFPAAESSNGSPAFSRFCSGSLCGQESGFDRPLYFAGEESSGADTFDGRGGVLTVTFDNEIHTLAKFPRFAWENALPRPFNGNETVVMCMEDGPATPDSQLYMYVGKKERRAGSSVLSRNGLDNGKVYVFVSNDPARNSEVTFQNGTVTGRWVEIANAGSLTDVQLEAAADSVGAFGFIRTEDGAWSKTSRKDYYFVTTGSSYSATPGGTPANKLGRIYQLQLNPGNPLKDATLTVLVNADQVIASGGDTALSPDNIDTNSDYLMVQEDGTAETRPVMASKGRDGSIWRFDLANNFAAQRVAQLNPPGRDNVPVGPGIWETSGIIDASALFGDNTWIFDVQAHRPTNMPAPGTVEDGQLLIMLPRAQ